MQPTAFTLNRSDGIRTHDLCVPNAALYIWNSEYLVKNMRKIWSIFLFDVMMKG